MDWWPPNPKSWSEFPAECFWYLIPGIVFHVIALVFSPALLLIFRRDRAGLPLKGQIMLFHIFLLGSAMIANGVWSCTIWGRYYWSVDYVSDFSAFIPMLRTQVEGSWGEGYSSALNGITLFQLNCIWFLFALATWTTAFMATRLVSRHILEIRQSKDESDSPECP